MKTKTAILKITPTKVLIYAASNDAANHSIRKRGLKVWDDEAVDAYHRVFDRLFEMIGGPEGWMNLQ